MSSKSVSETRAGLLVFAGAVVVSLGGVYLGLPWPRLALQAAALVAGLLGVAAAWRRTAGPRGIAVDWVAAPVRAAAWLLLLAVFTASVASTEIAVSLDSTVQALSYLVILVIAASVVRTESARKTPTAQVAALLLCAGAASVVIAIFFGWAGAADLHGAFGNKNHLAGYLLLLLPLTLAGLLSSQRRRASMAFGAALVVMASGLLLSQSRGAWLALAPGVAVVVLMLPRWRGWWGRLAVAGTLTLALSLLLNQAALQTTVSAGAAAMQDVAAATAGQSPEGTLGPRLDYWHGALAIAGEHPLLGTGPGTFASAFPAYQKNPLYYSKYAHQLLLQILAETGAPGLLALLGLLAAYAYNVTTGLSTRLAGEELNERILAVGLAGGLAASLVHNLVELDWYVPAIALLAAVVAGALLGLAARRGAPADAAIAPAAPWAAIEGWATVIVCVAGLTWTGFRAAEGWNLAAAAAALQRGDAPAAVASYRAAAAIDPLSAEPQKALAAMAFSPPAVWPSPAIDAAAGLVAARRAVSLASLDADAWVLLARGYQARGAPGDSEKSLEALAAAVALRQPQQVPELVAELMQGYLASGRPDEAGDLARRVVDGSGVVEPGSAGAHYVAQAHVVLGNLAARRGDTTEAMARYQAAVALDAANPAARFNLGIVLLDSGRPLEARAALAAAAGLDPRQAVVHYYLALAHRALGETAAARSELQEALSLDVACGACRELLDRLAGEVVP